MTHLVFAVLLSCTGGEDTGDSATQPDPEVDLDWGIVDACTASPAGGFADFYDTGHAVLVHGDSDEDRDLADQVYVWYGGEVDTFDRRAAAELTAEDRTRNLFILGSASTNPVLEELNGALPVWFEPERFTFGGYRYDEPGHGIALVHPSPFQDGATVLVYAGNTLDGARSLFTIWTGAQDYETVRGRGTLQQEGELCREGEGWGFHSAWDDDYRADWEGWVAGLEATQGDGHVFYATPDGAAAQDMDQLAPFQDAELARVLETLDVSPLDSPIRWYLYPDNSTKGDVTGSNGNGHANSYNFEVHAVYSDSTKAIGAHEDVHVVADKRIGAAGTALMGEGLAVWLDGSWWGEPLEDWVVEYRDAGSLPTLRSLIDDFWGAEDGITYPVAGHFVRWLQETWGLEVVKALYVAEDLESGFEAELSLSVAEVEQAWLDSL